MGGQDFDYEDICEDLVAPYERLVHLPAFGVLAFRLRQRAGGIAE